MIRLYKMNREDVARKVRDKETHPCLLTAIQEPVLAAPGPHSDSGLHSVTLKTVLSLDLDTLISQLL